MKNSKSFYKNKKPYSTEIVRASLSTFQASIDSNCYGNKGVKHVLFNLKNDGLKSQTRFAVFWWDPCCTQSRSVIHEKCNII